MPDTILPLATNDQRKRWADMLWSTIKYTNAGQTPYWTCEQLKLIAREIESPLAPNGDARG